MRGLINSGHADAKYFTDLFDFREWLIQLREDDTNRQRVRRDGNSKSRADGTLVLGPFTLTVRERILSRLKNLEEDTGQDLISESELDVIKDIWRRDQVREDCRVALRTAVSSETGGGKELTSQRHTVITSNAKFFSDLFHMVRFDVPWHQRYYDWPKDDVRALLHDVGDALKEKRDCYFLGAIMLVEIEPGRWEINDGQQRMVTISLISAALCRRFVRKVKGSQREGLALRMLFDLAANSTWTLDDAERYPPRISPPENDSARYLQMIRGNTIGTNGLLTAAWAKIERYFWGLYNKLSNFEVCSLGCGIS